MGGSSSRRAPQMIEKIIEASIRNRFIVLLIAAVLAVWGVYAVLDTPVDAIPDLSENQVIVFTDWMGRSPREIEDQVTYPLSLRSCRGWPASGRALVVRVQFLDDHRHLRGQRRLLFRSRARHREARRRPATCFRPAWCRTWPPTPRPSARSSGTRSSQTPTHPIDPPTSGRSTSSTSSPSSTRRGRGRRGHGRWHSRGISDRRSTRSSPGLRRYLGRTLRCRRQEQSCGGRRRGPEKQCRVHRARYWLDQRHQGHRKHRHQGGRRYAYLRQARSPRCRRAPSSAAASSRRTATRWSAALCSCGNGENPLAVTQRVKEKIEDLQSGIAGWRAHRPGLRPHPAHHRGDPHADGGDVARDDHRLRGHSSHLVARP